MTTLLMCSGGLDSTYCLQKYLEETSDEIHVHHIHLISPSNFNRWKLEKIAMEQIVLYFRNNGRQFRYTESTLDTTFLETLEYNKSPDHWTLLILQALIALQERKLDTVVLGYHDNYHDFPETRRDICELIVRSICRAHDKEISFSYPVKGKFKPEMLRYVHPELRKLTWSCRNPTPFKGKYMECGHCDPCSQIFASGLQKEPKIWSIPK